MSRKDASGATTQYNYNFNLGLRSSVTDPNLLTTSWTYDAFGRRQKESRPDQTYTQWAYNDCASQGGCLIGAHALAVTQIVYNTDNTMQTDGTTWFDPLERPLLSNKRLLGTGVYDRNEVRYDNLGHVVQQAFPCTFSTVTTNCPYWTTRSYDVLDRLTQSQRPISAANSTLQTASNQYQDQNRKTVVTDANSHAKTLVTDVYGWLRVIQDANGYAVTRGYDAAGSLTSVTDSLGNALFSASYAYGLGAFMTGSTDADLGGPWGYTIDALGERTAWSDAKGQSFLATYDALSRPATRTEPDLFTQWTWGTSAAAHEIGQLHSVCTGTGTKPTACASATGYAESETYDSVGRRFQRSIQIPGDATYTYTWSYNPTTQLLDTLTYPSSTAGYALVLKYGYTNGLLQSITDTSDSPNVTLWTVNAENARGQPTQETLGNNVVINHALDAVTGVPGSITAGVGGGAALQNNAYLFDEVGNLTQRQDNNHGLTENSYPDSLNRIDHTTLNNVENLALSYDLTGNILTAQIEGATTNSQNFSTNQPGCTSYSNSQPHALRSITKGSQVTSFCYDANGNVVSESLNGMIQASGIWTSYNQLASLTGTSSTSSAFSYDANHQRYKQVATFPGGIPETTIYVGGLLEKVNNPNGTTYRHYVPAGNSVIVYNRIVNGSNTLYYLTSDHLGSTTAITDPSGHSVLTENFAAFGWRRGDNWTGKPTATELQTIDGITHRGFTFQERLDNLNLTHFNGRVYGETGEFFSPDPFIADPTNTQDYNRYAYVRNNPVTYTDPSGLCVEIYDLDGNLLIPCDPGFIPDPRPPYSPPPPSLVPVARPSLENLTPPQIRLLPPETGLQTLQQCIAEAIGGSPGSESDSGTLQTLSNLGQGVTAAGGANESLLNASAAAVGRAFGNGVLPGGVTPPTNAGYAAFGAQIQSSLESLSPWLKGGGNILGLASIGVATFNGYQSNGTPGAMSAAAYGAADFAVETAMSAAGPLGAAGAIGYDRVGGTKTVATGLSLTAAIAACNGAQGLPSAY